MFIVVDDIVYKVTRETAKESFKLRLTEKLSHVYAKSIFDSVISEIMQHVEFPKIMDSNSIFVYKNNEFEEYSLEMQEITRTGKQYVIEAFAPTYTGVEVSEVTELLMYTVSSPFHKQDSYRKAIIVHTQDGWNAVSMEEDCDKVIKDALKEILNEEQSEKIADSIVENIFTSSVFCVALRKENDLCYFGLENGSCKEIIAFSATELYKIIMKSLPKLKVLSEEAKLVSNLIHNRLLYKANVSSTELKNPFKFDGDVPIFKKVVNGIELTLDLDEGTWYSDYIKVSLDQIKWKAETDTSKYQRGEYGGLQILSYPKLDNNWEKDEYLLYSNRREFGGGLYYCVKTGTDDPHYVKPTAEVYVKLFFDE